MSIIHRFRIHGPRYDETVVLPVGEIDIGRDTSNQIVLPHRRVARVHARLEISVDGVCRIKSQSGSFVRGQDVSVSVNGVELRSQVYEELKDGDIVDIGPFKLTYERAGDVPIEEEIPDADTLRDILADEDVIVAEVIEEAPAPTQGIPYTATVNGKNGANGSPPNGADLTFSGAINPEEEFLVWPSLSFTDSKYMRLLPEIYSNPKHLLPSEGANKNNDDRPEYTFTRRFMALLESIFEPIKVTAGNFDMFLDPATAPTHFLLWLSRWFDMTFDDSWDEYKKRTLLAEAHEIYQFRGTKHAMSRVLAIYTGYEPVIDDLIKGAPFVFHVRFPFSEKKFKRVLLERLIDAHKPAHTSYRLFFAS